MQNEMIKKAEAEIDAKVKEAEAKGAAAAKGSGQPNPFPPGAYDRIVLAGMKVMFEDEQMHAKLLQGLKESPEVKTVVEGIIGILGILFKESRNTMPPGPMVLAGQSLMMEALDFMEEGGMIEVTPQVLDEATQLYIETMLPKIGLNPKTFAAKMAEAQAIMSDPQKMAQFKQAQGA